MSFDAIARGAAALSLALALTACASGESYKLGTISGDRPRPVSDDLASAATGELSVTEFVQRAASSTHYEVQSAKLVSQKGVSEALRQLAQRMESDHRKANDQLRQLASQLGIVVPAAMRTEHQELMNKLGTRTGEQLERTYLAQQVAAHRDAIELFERARDELDEASLASFAARKLPLAREHLALVLAAQRDVGAARPAGS